ncbi:MAG: bifunctional 2-polyprenyl-6-hydroxyphenol methylase/3-demethylubiquinol 3-O-methyltransferase UbiG [Hyphomicrobiales bacterium]|nr:bifunctional 2-polyprenyl-6-hydroxyphenol methylase/3-demethylubiquinol 3-O-methyltransferase UbiG [Hyphomicrobiales bacterium]
MVQAAPMSASVDPADVARFNALGQKWWDLWGPMRALHKLNPTRVNYIRDILLEEMRREAPSDAPLEGLRILDIGCGAGILSEPLARLGAKMTSIDPAPVNIDVARAHAAESGLSIDYRTTTAEDLAATGEKFDAVLIMEVIEHVNDRSAFIATAAKMARPGGFVFAATLNRTFKSYALAIVGAEYILRWVDKGTHDWRQFVTPQELAADLRACGLEIYDRTGVVYNPVFDEWRTSDDCAVNYMMAAQKPA